MFRPSHVSGLLLAPVLFLPALIVSASHGPTRSGSDSCNGTAAFNVNNLITRDVVAAIAAQNPGSQNADGTIDRTKITHALLTSSGHAALQVRAAAGAPLDRVQFQFSATSPAWTPDSTNHPAYATAIEALETPDRPADADLVLGGTFIFLIPTDVVSDGNYVARLVAFNAGAEVGRLCLDALVANGQGPTGAAQANSDPAYEPAETAGNEGFVPQPILWFPAAEPSATQQAGYGAKALRIEFAEALTPGSLAIQRDQSGVWVDYTSLAAQDDFQRPHFVAGGRADAMPAEAVANEKVWGPGFRLPLDALPAESLPTERLRISATDLAGKAFCGVYTFQPGPNGSFLTSAPGSC